MKRNLAKEKIELGKPIIGAFSNIPSPQVTEICGYLGFDHIVFDAEHGSLSEERCEDLVRAAESVGITPFVRVPHHSPEIVLRFMDTGALGIHIPQINTAEEAEAAVRAVKYWPRGERGLAGTRASGWGLPAPLGEYVQQANRETMIVAHMEDVRALQNLPEILAVDDIDVIYIGPTDLSHSLGLPGQGRHPRVQEVIDEVVKLVVPSSKALGMYCADAEMARAYLDRGALYIVVHVAGLLTKAGRAFLEEVRSE